MSSESLRNKGRIRMDVRTANGDYIAYLFFLFFIMVIPIFWLAIDGPDDGRVEHLLEVTKDHFEEHGSPMECKICAAVFAITPARQHEQKEIHSEGSQSR